MASLAVGQTARVVFRSEPERWYPGKVVRLARQADRETREFLVDVQVEELPHHWAVGQRAEVYILTERKENVPAVPPQVVLWNNGRPSVFVDDGGRARRHEVTLGLRGRELVEVATGLEPGQVVVAPLGDGVGQLQDGARIQP
jgi:HlyD family secretion protein